MDFNIKYLKKREKGVNVDKNLMLIKYLLCIPIQQHGLTLGFICVNSLYIDFIYVNR